MEHIQKEDFRYSLVDIDIQAVCFVHGSKLQCRMGLKRCIDLRKVRFYNSCHISSHHPYSTLLLEEFVQVSWELHKKLINIKEIVHFMRTY